MDLYLFSLYMLPRREKGILYVCYIYDANKMNMCQPVRGVCISRNYSRTARYVWDVRNIKPFGVVISVFLRDVNKICALFGFLRSVESQKIADLVFEQHFYHVGYFMVPSQCPQQRGTKKFEHVKTNSHVQIWTVDVIRYSHLARRSYCRIQRPLWASS